MILDTRDLLEALCEAQSSVLDDTPRLLTYAPLQEFLNAYRAYRRFEVLGKGLEEFMATLPEGDPFIEATQSYLLQLRSEKSKIRAREVDQLSQVWERPEFLSDPFAGVPRPQPSSTNKVAKDSSGQRDINIVFSMKENNFGASFPRIGGEAFLIRTRGEDTQALRIADFDYVTRQKILSAAKTIHGPVLVKNRSQKDILEAVKALSPALLEGEHVVVVIFVSAETAG